MKNSIADPSQLTPEAKIKGILEWLALAHDRTGSDDSDQLLHQFAILRETPLPPRQWSKLHELLHRHVERIVGAELPRLQEITLPISRKTRQRVRLLSDMLSAVTQDYFNTLADLFDPLGDNTPKALHLPLTRIMKTIGWQARICYLVAAPTPIGLWHQLYSAFETARRFELANLPGPRGEPTVQRSFANILLTAIAQPASFSSVELNFIREFVERHPANIEFFDQAPPSGHGIFWIDLDKDFGAHALIRKAPPPGTRTLFFSSDALGEAAIRFNDALQQGATAAELGLPDFADTRSGQATLKRLAMLWGNPVKRKFPRRRHSYRAHLCLGLGHLWQLLKHPDAKPVPSEWMVTNESPDGFALMHMSGQTAALRVGDIVALQPQEEPGDANPVWHICLIRWALSENPEHIEIGLEILAPRAIAAEIAQPDTAAGCVSALLLPETPPLHPGECLVVPAGSLGANNGLIILMVEGRNLEIREIRATHLDEHTGAIEVFSVSPDDSP